MWICCCYWLLLSTLTSITVSALTDFYRGLNGPNWHNQQGTCHHNYNNNYTTLHTLLHNATTSLQPLHSLNLGWDTIGYYTTDPCAVQWYGVVCSGGHVISMYVKTQALQKKKTPFRREFYILTRITTISRKPEIV